MAWHWTRKAVREILDPFHNRMKASACPFQAVCALVPIFWEQSEHGEYGGHEECRSRGIPLRIAVVQVVANEARFGVEWLGDDGVDNALNCVPKHLNTLGETPEVLKRRLRYPDQNASHSVGYHGISHGP